jgi:hypothetical protein
MSEVPRPLPLLLASALTLTLGLAGCGEAARELASGSGGASGAGAFVDALAGRFGPIDREPAFDALRPKLVRAALAPSRVFDEPGAWTARGDDWRAVDFLGHGPGGAYRLGVRASAPTPREAGDYRGRLRLQRTGDGRFVWTMHEELAIGPTRPCDLAAALTALFRAAESTGGGAARARAREGFPRATAAVSRLLRLEALEAVREGGGATSVRMAVRLDPEGVRAFAPHYADFLKKYASPMRLRGAVQDLSGAAWWSLDGAENLWTLRLRILDGSLVPLEGPADRRLPGNVRATIDYSTKMGLFRVGVRRLVADVALTRSPVEKAITAHFLEEPDWQVPFLIQPLMRGPLRYPFEGEGSAVGWAAREQADGPTVLEGRYRGQIRESWIVRWLGGLSSSAVSDFRQGAEAEADRFNLECLAALGQDIAALVAPSR